MESVAQQGAAFLWGPVGGTSDPDWFASSPPADPELRWDHEEGF